MIEQTQVKVRLIPEKNYSHLVPETQEEITGQQIHKQMSKNGVFRNDAEGKFVMLLFNGQPIKFYPGKLVQLGKSVGKALIHGSLIVVGSDKLNGPHVPFLEIVEEFQTGSEIDRRAPFACPVCGEDQENPARLTRHLIAERKKHPELFEEKEKSSRFDEVSDASGDGEESNALVED